MEMIKAAYDVPFGWIMVFMVVAMFISAVAAGVVVLIRRYWGTYNSRQNRKIMKTKNTGIIHFNLPVGKETFRIMSEKMGHANAAVSLIEKGIKGECMRKPKRKDWVHVAAVKIYWELVGAEAIK